MIAKLKGTYTERPKKVKKLPEETGVENKKAKKKAGKEQARTAAAQPARHPLHPVHSGSTFISFFLGIEMTSYNLNSGSFNNDCYFKRL